MKRFRIECGVGKSGLEKGPSLKIEWREPGDLQLDKFVSLMFKMLRTEASDKIRLRDRLQ